MKLPLLMLQSILPVLALAQAPDTLLKRNKALRLKIENRLDSLAGNQDHYYILESDSGKREDVYISKRLFEKILKNEYPIKDVLQTEKNSRCGTRVFQLITDQDVIPKMYNKDMDYTMGVEFSWSGSARLWNVRDTASSLYLLLDSNWQHSAYRFSFGLSAFTPYELQMNTIDSTDRPYSAILFFTYGRSHSFKAPKKIRTRGLEHGLSYQLLLGGTGRIPSQISNFVQTGIHSGQRATRRDTRDVRPDPKGWSLGIGNGSEFPMVGNLNLTYFWLYGRSITEEKENKKKVRTGPLKFLAKPSVGIDAGLLYNKVDLGGQLLVGFFNKDPFDGLMPNILYDKGTAPNTYISFVLENYHQYWLHNATLNGNVLTKGTDPYIIDKQDIKRWTSFLNYGIELGFKNVRVGATYFSRAPLLLFSERQHRFTRFSLKLNY